jgi:hypothetical protein
MSGSTIISNHNTDLVLVTVLACQDGDDTAWHAIDPIVGWGNRKKIFLLKKELKT